MTSAETHTPPNGGVATLADFKQARTCRCQLPSGLVVLLRPVNVELHAMSGGLPTTLRRMTALSTKQIHRQFATAGEDGDEDAMVAARQYMDNIVRNMVIEPAIPDGTDMDELFLPADYHFLFRVAQRELDEDATGRRLWGVEPISRWALFRDEHGCEEDCEACGRVSDQLSAYQP